MTEVASKPAAEELVVVDAMATTQNEPLIVDPLTYDASEMDPLSSEALIKSEDSKTHQVEITDPIIINHENGNSENGQNDGTKDEECKIINDKVDKSDVNIQTKENSDKSQESDKINNDAENNELEDIQQKSNNSEMKVTLEEAVNQNAKLDKEVAESCLIKMEPHDAGPLTSETEIQDVIIKPQLEYESVEKLDKPLAIKSENANSKNEIVEEKSEPCKDNLDCIQVKSVSENIQPKDEIIAMDLDVNNGEIKNDSKKESEALTECTSWNENSINDIRVEIKSDSNKEDCINVNGNKKTENEMPQKRSNSTEINEELCPSKKLCQEVEKIFPQHDKILTEFIQNTTRNNLEEIQHHTDQLLTEINTLREMAQKKEQEWNNILHLKKVKEEVLLRLLRKKQVISFEKSSNTNGTDSMENGTCPKDLTIDKSDEISGVSLKPPTPNVNNNGHKVPTPPQIPSVSKMYEMLHAIPDKPLYTQQYRPILPKPMMMGNPPKLPSYNDFNGQFGYTPMGRQGPIKDVKSIIADYRQKNPEQLQQAPRRGRRMKSILNPQAVQMSRPPTPHDSRINDLGMLLNSIDMSQKSMLERLTQSSNALTNGMSFKDVLVQFANMQQNAATAAAMMANARNQDGHHKLQDNPKDKNPPPPYPEISLHPVSTSTAPPNNEQQSSLLHGILTKQKSPSGTPQLTTRSKMEQFPAFSPTLAKLLKERASDGQHNAAESAAAALVQAKNCGEITITPVHTSHRQEHQQQLQMNQEKSRTETDVVQLDDEESAGSDGSNDGSTRRLVIDESATVPAPGAAQSDVPVCQGCKRRHAQFVCAGCANQWYCSRECQVAAWDEHSEMCSG